MEGGISIAGNGPPQQRLNIAIVGEEQGNFETTQSTHRGEERDSMGFAVLAPRRRRGVADVGTDTIQNYDREGACSSTTGVPIHSASMGRRRAGEQSSGSRKFVSWW